MMRHTRIVLATASALLLTLSICGCSRQAETSKQDDSTTKELRKAKNGD